MIERLISKALRQRFPAGERTVMIGERQNGLLPARAVYRPESASWWMASCCSAPRSRR